MPVSHKALQPIDIIESPIQLNQCVEVSYEYIGLSKKGDEFIKGFTPPEYKAFIGEWNSLLESYFESKC